MVIRFHHEILEVSWLEPLLFQLGFLFQRLHAWRSLTLARAAVFRGRTFGSPKGKMDGTLIQRGFWGAEQFGFCWNTCGFLFWIYINEVTSSERFMKSVFCFFCVVEASMRLPNASKGISGIWSQTVLDWCCENCSSERNWIAVDGWTGWNPTPWYVWVSCQKNLAELATYPQGQIMVNSIKIKGMNILRYLDVFLHCSLKLPRNRYTILQHHPPDELEVWEIRKPIYRLHRPWFKEGGNEQNQEIHGDLSKRIFNIVDIYVRMYIILLYYIIHHKCLHAYGTGRIYTSIGDAIFRMLQSL